jgi:hypothetical protein
VAEEADISPREAASRFGGQVSVLLAKMTRVIEATQTPLSLPS